MKPVTQTQFGRPNGNCFASCVASILELELTEVPNFCAGRVKDWMVPFQDWLAERGLHAIEMTVADQEAWIEASKPCGWCILSGPAPRGLAHSVVARDGRMVHDPHPSGTGLEMVKQAMFFVALDPVAVRVAHEPVEPYIPDGHHIYEDPDYGEVFRKNRPARGLAIEPFPLPEGAD